jgi:spore germination protein KA
LKRQAAFCLLHGRQTKEKGLMFYKRSSIFPLETVHTKRTEREESVLFFWKRREKVPYHPRKEPKYDLPLTAESIKSVFAQAEDFVHRKVLLDGSTKWELDLFFIDGMVSSSTINESIIRPMANGVMYEGDESAQQVIRNLREGGVYNASVQTRTTVDEVTEDLVNGFCVLLFEKQKLALSFETRTEEKRSVSSPKVENVLKGAKDGLVETLRTNTSLIRRHLRTPDLQIQEQIVGRQTHTKIAVVSIRGLTNTALVQTVMEKLRGMDVDGALSGAVLEEYLTQTVKTAFPLMLFTERTDRFAAGLIEGRVGLLIDGVPIGYLLPSTLAHFMLAPEDRESNYMQATMIRMVRYIALWINLLLPGFYIAVSTFHQEMIPTALLRSIIESKQNVPFPTVFEVFGLLFAFEILQEAGQRLPTTIGQTVSIIGGLVVGQSAVEAQILSPVIIIVVAITGIAGYTIPNRDFAGAIRIWRFFIAFASAVLGLLGTATAGLALLYHLAKLESFGVPYLSPFAAKKAKEPGSTDGSGAVRPPLKDMKYRESDLNPQNIRRRK